MPKKKKKKRKPRTKRAIRLRQAHLVEPVEDRVDEFMEEFKKSGNITAASEVCGFNRRCVYDWKEIFPDLEQELADARLEAIERLEEEARARATKGVNRPVFQKGKKVGYVTHYSDNLLMFLLKGNAPEKFRDNLNVTGRQEHNIDLNLKSVVKEVWEKLDKDDDLTEKIIDQA